jgi:hypothetical protein
MLTGGWLMDSNQRRSSSNTCYRPRRSHPGARADLILAGVARSRHRVHGIASKSEEVGVRSRAPRSIR